MIDAAESRAMVETALVANLRQFGIAELIAAAAMVRQIAEGRPVTDIAKAVDEMLEAFSTVMSSKPKVG